MTRCTDPSKAVVRVRMLLNLETTVSVMQTEQTQQAKFSQQVERQVMT